MSTMDQPFVMGIPVMVLVNVNMIVMAMVVMVYRTVEQAILKL